MLKKIQSSIVDEKYIIEKGISGIDISKEIEVEDILIRKGARSVASAEDLPFEVVYHVNCSDFYAYKEVYTKLGLLMFELLFSKQTYITCNIPHEQSEVKQIFICLDREGDVSHFLKVKEFCQYEHYEYYPKKFEWRGGYSEDDEEEKGVMEFNYSCSKPEDRYSPDFISKADQLVIRTTISGLLNLAEFFLNMGRIENECVETYLENSLYFGGSGSLNSRSIEARFWLPSSFGFYTDDINELEF